MCVCECHGVGPGQWVMAVCENMVAGWLCVRGVSELMDMRRLVCAW